MVKKRKKKIFTTLKKIKHQHVNRKLSIINTIRNNPRCLNCGNTMAVHYDRFCCSYCNESKTNFV